MSAGLVVSGATGRMGRQVARLAAESDRFRIAGGIAATARNATDAGAAGYPCVETVESAAALLAEADAVVDFSADAQLARLIGIHGDVLAGRALIVGTTGLADSTIDALAALAERGPVVRAANFSIGVNLLLVLVAEAARRLAAADYDAEIVEAHHRGKADSPSGTALALGEAVARGRGERLEHVRRDGRSGHVGRRPAGEIGFHAVRGGDVVGEHTVSFLGRLDRFELKHAASDRALFADGALAAAEWAIGRRPGSYTMKDVLGF